MALHFLRTAKYRNFSRNDIDKFSDEEIVQLFAEMRWGKADEQICPSCHSTRNHYWRRHRHQWRCRDCGRDFSVTSGTPFAYHKISLRVILQALHSYCVTAKGRSSIEMGAELGMTDLTTWLLMSKFREILLKIRPVDVGSGIFQADGGWFGGKRRDANRHGAGLHGTARDQAIKQKIESGAPSGRQRRYRQMAPGAKANAMRRLKRRCVLVIRELYAGRGSGARRTIVTVAMSENEIDMTRFIRRFVPEGSTIMTDESNAFTPLSNWYKHKSVAHAIEYVSKDGVNDNQAESYFSRLRRAEYGVHHRFTPMHLFEYANEKAWREDSRRHSMREKTLGLLKSAMQAGKSIVYRGYFQGNRMKVEVLNG